MLVVGDVQWPRAALVLCGFGNFMLVLPVTGSALPDAGHRPQLAALLSQEAVARGGQIHQLGMEIEKEAR